MYPQAHLFDLAVVMRSMGLFATNDSQLKNMLRMFVDLSDFRNALRYFSAACVL